MASTIQALQFAFKTLWPQTRIQDEVYKKHAFLAMVPKSENFVGDSEYIVLQTGDSQARSQQFSTAQTISALTGAGNAGSSRGSRFLLTRVKDYQIVNLDTEAMLASQGEGALLKSLDVEMRGAVRNLGKSLAVALYRGQTGVLSTVGSFTGTTVTLSNINDVTSFEVGMQLVFAANTASALRASGASITITGVDRDLGVLTFASTAAITGLANADSIFANGDYTAANDKLKCSGLLDWIPSTTPSATTFFGVDRSTDPTRLAGLRIDASALNPEEAVVLSLSRLAREGGDPSHMFVNHFDYRNILYALGSKVEMMYETVGEIGFQTLRIQGTNGQVRVIADQDCPAGRGFLLDMSTWHLHTLGPAPRVLDQDGNQLSRVYNADAFEARLAYWGNLYTDAPGYNANIAMPT